MLNHVLSHNEISDNGSLFAIHSSLEPFSLAFKINYSLNTKLVRCGLDITFKNNEENYMVYKNFPKENETQIWLFSNSFTVYSKSKSSVFLFEEEQVERSLLPEFPKVDFVLKIIGEKTYCSKFTKKLNLMAEILSCYPLPEKKIKSKHNLIFD